MTRYKSVIVSKYTKRGMMKAVDQTIVDHLYRGYEFVQMCGDPIESMMLLFKIDGDEKAPPTRKELKQMEKERKARAKQKGKKHEEDQQRELKHNEPQKIESNPVKLEPTPIVVAPILTKAAEPIVVQPVAEPKVIVEPEVKPAETPVNDSGSEPTPVMDKVTSEEAAQGEVTETVGVEPAKKPKRIPPKRTKKTP